MSLRESIEKIRRSPVPANEQETITTILMILRDLGWDPFGEEVRQEYPVGGGRIDIALIAPSRVVAFIEAKAPGEYLHRHVDQIVGYAFREGADICALTNGTEWWLYLPLERLPFEQRRFAVLKTREDPIEQLADDLETFLGKHNLLSRQAERRAKCVLEAKREADHLKTKIPEVWNQMVAGPDDDLVELVGKRVYEKTSLRPAKEQVAAALRGSPIPTVVKSKPARPTPKPTPPTPPGAGRQRPTAVRLWGQRYDVKNWTDMLVTVADALHGRQGADFDRVLDLRSFWKRLPLARPCPPPTRSRVRGPIESCFGASTIQSSLGKTFCSVLPARSTTGTAIDSIVS
ncbi:MAG: hypothetical protein OXS29_02425 [bacterium]|nr:hypothetical protein [bacterium]MDE0288420.1 hypothetical protein [bacterium]MDE0438362.1 hypothetical protein [bacterium]